MINRVILCGVLTEEPRFFEGEKTNSVTFKIRVARYGRSYCVIPAKAWGRTADYFNKSCKFRKGQVVQIVGTLGIAKHISGEYMLDLSIDSLNDVQLLTEQLKDFPWDDYLKKLRGGTSQAS